MIKIRRNADRGYAHFGWLESRHTFSFGSYFDPQQMGISELRVANDDLLSPGASLDPIKQQDMEIISYILDGQTLHKDSLGNQTLLPARSIQLLSTGSGAEYSEQNPSADKNLNLLQFWIVPDQIATEPGYQSTRIKLKDGATLLISPDGRDNSLQIRQQLFLYQLKLNNTSRGLPASDNGFLHVLKGEVELNGSYLQPGDGAIIEDEQFLSLRSLGRAEILYFALP
ncbi:pirin family protein [Amphritea sp. HPY]|uniref:pirin family protein n=1 Tax=Amphritea sp. HPY TaxID=3421652 RepID=UPI003D7E671A